MSHLHGHGYAEVENTVSGKVLDGGLHDEGVVLGIDHLGRHGQREDRGAHTEEGGKDGRNERGREKKEGRR
jgi:hypothetical protein